MELDDTKIDDAVPKTPWARREMITRSGQFRARAFLVLTIVLGASRLASAQAQARVVKDQSIVWNLSMPTPITTVRIGTVLEVIGSEGAFYVVRLPATGGRVAQTGRIAVSQVEIIAGTAPAQAPSPQTRQTVGRTAEPAIGLFGFAQGGMNAWLADQTFSAVLGTARTPILGTGAQVRVHGRLMIQGAVEHFRKSGQRVFVSNGQVFTLGIRDTVQIVPLSVTASYRQRGRRAAYYGGGGIGRYFYKEDSDFALPEENITQRFTSYHVVGGVEFGPLSSVLKTAFEFQFTTVPNALGTSGASAAFGEHNLGGIQFRIKVLAGR